MADTKKEHYVPRCYLENFATSGKRIDVFDKWKLMIRSKQDIMNVAMENGFYDLDILGSMEKLDDDVYEKAKIDLMEIVGTERWEDVEAIIGDKKHIEKAHFANLEGVYSEVLKSIIGKSYNGNNWVLKNCKAMSEQEKVVLSLFIAIQVIRTKRFRSTLSDTLTGAVQALAYKAQIDDSDALPRDAFLVEANPEYIKLQHSMMILDPETAIHIAETLVEHVWVICVNKTDIPFFTSDDPVVRIPHKKDKFISHSGFASEGIEIAFPISSKLMLCMFDKKCYGHIFQDRQFWIMDDTEEVKYYNMYQVINSYRCVFAVENDFEFAKQYCEEHPEMQKYHPQIEVL